VAEAVKGAAAGLGAFLKFFFETVSQTDTQRPGRGQLLFGASSVPVTHKNPDPRDVHSANRKQRGCREKGTRKKGP
jgi:hypothetical protein